MSTSEVVLLKSLGENGLSSSERLNNERFVKIRSLVSKLDADPNDDDTAEVVMDFCAEIGFAEIAQKIRRGKELNEGARRQLRLMVVNSLRVLFGDSDHDPSEAMYTHVLGIPSLTVAGGETMAIRTQAILSFQCRKLVLESSSLEQFVVYDIKIGNWSNMSGTEEVPATIYGAARPPTMRHFLGANTTAQVIVRNNATMELPISGCFLGVNKNVLLESLDSEGVGARTTLLERALEVETEKRKAAEVAFEKLEKRLDMLEAVFTKKV